VADKRRFASSRRLNQRDMVDGVLANEVSGTTTIYELSTGS
jgi:hypothetical protein